jgi:dTDP-4-amino-4,6-dideoxygalactose transaminase
MKEIGSEFWILNNTDNFFDKDISWINSWGNNILTSSGRGAISKILKIIEKKVICKVALLPAYICNSVIIPFIRKGYTCFFYDINRNLEPDYESIDFFLNNNPGVFLHIGYYGFPTNNRLKDFIIKNKNKGVIIIEDITHSLFSDYNRYNENDYFIASLRKWTGLPSGGFLASKNNFIINDLSKETSFFKIRKEALVLKGRYIKNYKQEFKEKFLKMFSEAESILNNNPNPYLIDDVSRTMIHKIDINEIKFKRRENFLFLLDNLKNVNGVTYVFEELPIDICPFFFPVYIKKGRDQFRKQLISNNIYCPIHWEMPRSLNNIELRISREIYNSIISIPIDQRYSTSDMGIICDIIKNILK